MPEFVCVSEQFGGVRSLLPRGSARLNSGTANHFLCTTVPLAPEAFLKVLGRHFHVLFSADPGNPSASQPIRTN